MEGALFTTVGIPKLGECVNLRAGLLSSNPERGIRIHVPKPRVRRECRKQGKRLRRIRIRKLKS